DEGIEIVECSDDTVGHPAPLGGGRSGIGKVAAFFVRGMLHRHSTHIHLLIWTCVVGARLVSLEHQGL
ncbi:MAG: hypothetical protein MI892_30625, partial [Desulfobacterales bacterium]|nr:hypothetical protein [Desulfobacterales bacterium]